MVWGAALQRSERHTSWVSAVVAFSPDGRRLASAPDDQTVRLWDPAIGAALQRFKGHIHGVDTVTFSPDGRQLASASRDQTVRLWDPATGAALQRLEGHTHVVKAVVFSPDSRHLWTNMGTIQIQPSISTDIIPSESTLETMFFLNDEWVSREGENFLRLRFNYRPRCTAICKGTVAVEFLSGQVLILEFQM